MRTLSCFKNYQEVHIRVGLFFLSLVPSAAYSTGIGLPDLGSIGNAILIVIYFAYIAIPYIGGTLLLCVLYKVFKKRRQGQAKPKNCLLARCPACSKEVKWGDRECSKCFRTFSEEDIQGFKNKLRCGE